MSHASPVLGGGPGALTHRGHSKPSVGSKASGSLAYQGHSRLSISSKSSGVLPHRDHSKLIVGSKASGVPKQHLADSLRHGKIDIKTLLAHKHLGPPLKRAALWPVTQTLGLALTWRPTVLTQHGVMALCRHSALGQRVVDTVASASLGSATRGAAAMQHVSRIARLGTVTVLLEFLLLSALDAWRLRRGAISWREFRDRVGENAADALGTLAGTGASVVLLSAAGMSGWALALAGITGGLMGGYAAMWALRKVRRLRAKDVGGAERERAETAEKSGERDGDRRNNNAMGDDERGNTDPSIILITLPDVSWASDADSKRPPRHATAVAALVMD